jgi:hypothetical protein
MEDLLSDKCLSFFGSADYDLSNAKGDEYGVLEIAHWKDKLPVLK